MFPSKHIRNTPHSHHAHRQIREDDYELIREKEMNRNRIVLVGIVLVLGYFFNATWAVYVGLLAHLAGSLTVALTYQFQDTPSNIRRFCGLCVDFGAGIYLFSIGGESVAALYPLYLWIILGYGFRFGNRWLFIAATMGATTFGWSILNVPFWRENASLATGLVIGLLVVPAYCSTLITKISQAKEEAEQANKAKTLFLASISHELRTPLNAIIGYGTHMLAMDLPEKQNKMVSTSVSAGRHLLHLINQLLNFAKSESLEELPEPEQFRPIDILTEVRDIMQISANEQGLVLHLQAEPMSDRMITGQADYIKNILINLTSNAVKFTDSGSVSIKCGFTEEAGRHILQCSVTDTGPGIPRDAQEKIFGVFEQADDDVSTTFGGTGLGLSICRQLAEQMGGQVSVESSLGVGSSFMFSCPIDLIEVANDGEVEEVIRIISLGVDETRPIIASDDDERLQVEHIDCSTMPILDEIIKNKYLGRYDIALIASEIADQYPDGSPIWQYFTDAKLPPVLLSGDEIKTLKDIQLRAAFASVLPATPDFQAIRSAVQIGCSFVTDQGQLDDRPNSKPSVVAARKILVADDNRTNQMVLETILSNAGHKVVVVNDGEEALTELERQSFDIVFLDVNMPNMGGIECCKLWRQIEGSRNHLPMVGLTADSTAETEMKCLDAGMDLRLTKPIEADQLLQTIEQQLGSEAKNTGLSADPDPFGNVQNIDQSIQSERGAAVDPAQLDYLLSIGDEEFVSSIIDAYLKDAEQILDDFTAASKDKNIVDFRFHAHAFKSGANNIGAMRLSEMCEKLEVISEPDFHKNHIRYLNEIADEVSRVSICLEKRRAQPPSRVTNKLDQTG